MYLYTNEYLRDYMTPERFALCQNAADIFMQFNRDDVNEEIERYFIGLGDYVDVESVDKVYGVYYTSLLGIVNDFGIMLVDEYDGMFDLSFLISIIYALIYIEDYEDKSTVVNLLSSDLSNEEILAEIMSLTGSCTSDEYLMYLKDVSEDLLDRIRDISLLGSEEQSFLESNENLEETRERIVAVKKLNEFMDKGLYGFLVVKSGAKINMSFENYWNLFKDKLLSDEVNLPDNLFILATISKDGYNNQVECIQHYIKEIETDSNKQAHMFGRLRELSLSLTKR